MVWPLPPMDDVVGVSFSLGYPTINLLVVIAPELLAHIQLHHAGA